MMTGDQYKASLDDGRATYFEGKRVDDLPGHPILGQTVEAASTPSGSSRGATTTWTAPSGWHSPPRG